MVMTGVNNMADNVEPMDLFARERNEEIIAKLFGELTEKDAKELLKGATNVFALVGSFINVKMLVSSCKTHEEGERVKVEKFIDFMNKIESLISW